MAPPSRSSRTIRRMSLFVAPAIVFLGILGYALAQKPPPPQPGDRAPGFNAPLLDGSGTLDLASLRGRPVLVNFWASWCQPCKQEAPLLLRAYRAYHQKVAFVGVDVRDSVTDARRFVRDHHVPYPSVRDEDLSISTAYGTTGQPETFLIDKNGVIVQHVPGPFVTAADLFQQLESVVARDD